MKLYLGLMWIKSNRSLKSAFGLPGAFDLFDEYLGRLGKYCEFQAGPVKVEALTARAPGEMLWVCERLKGKSKTLSSEELAAALDKLRNLGAKKLWVVIGPPDGLSKETLEAMKPDLLWSFGPATLPHELATIVAAEQLYRGWSILKGHPYHLGH